MSSFCPTCGNALLVKLPKCYFVCRTCPYTFQIKSDITFPLELKKKKVDDVLGGEKAWESGDKTEIECPKCQGQWAYFMQVQTRSADEPMTTFYKCADINNCGFRWKEN